MPSRAVEDDGKLGVWEAFDSVAGLQIVLAETIGRQPPRCGVVDERIVEGLGQLVAEGGDVGEGRIAENTGRDPAGVVQHIALLAEAIGGAPSLEIVCVEAEDAAVVGVADVEKSIGKEKGGEVARADVAGSLSGP